MIENSFIFLKGFGYIKERKLWEQGILDWNDFLNTEKIKGISRKNKLKFDRMTKDAMTALDNKDIYFFKKYFPKKETWRMYPWLKEETIYLDIETDQFGKLLVISLYNGEFVKTFVRNFNLEFYTIKRILDNAKMIVTFNGSSFDILILKHYIKFKNDIIHFDLRPAFVRLGYNTSLKNIEKIFHIKRDDNIIDLRGKDALELWKFFKATGSKNALELIIKYNQYDAINLKVLAEIAYEKLKKKITVFK